MDDAIVEQRPPEQPSRRAHVLTPRRIAAVLALVLLAVGLRRHFDLRAMSSGTDGGYSSSSASCCFSASSARPEIGSSVGPADIASNGVVAKRG
jgi:hypothetical protein